MNNCPLYAYKVFVPSFFYNKHITHDIGLLFLPDKMMKGTRTSPPLHSRKTHTKKQTIKTCTNVEILFISIQAQKSFYVYSDNYVITMFNVTYCFQGLNIKYA